MSCQAVYFVYFEVRMTLGHNAKCLPARFDNFEAAIPARETVDELLGKEGGRISRRINIILRGFHALLLKWRIVEAEGESNSNDTGWLLTEWGRPASPVLAGQRKLTEASVCSQGSQLAR